MAAAKGRRNWLSKVVVGCGWSLSLAKVTGVSCWRWQGEWQQGHQWCGDEGWVYCWLVWYKLLVTYQLPSQTLSWVYISTHIITLDTLCGFKPSNLPTWGSHFPLLLVFVGLMGVTNIWPFYFLLFFPSFKGDRNLSLEP